MDGVGGVYEASTGWFCLRQQERVFWAKAVEGCIRAKMVVLAATSSRYGPANKEGLSDHLKSVHGIKRLSGRAEGRINSFSDASDRRRHGEANLGGKAMAS